MTQISFVICLMLMAVVLLTGVQSVALAQALSAQPPGNPVLGKDKSYEERCQECHGETGHGQGHSNGPEGKFAKLAGQSVAYMLKQLEDFRSGARKHDQMAIMARSVSDEDLRDITAYFASQSPMKGEAVAVPEVAKKLYTQGDPARSIQACMACHGANGKGMPGQVAMPVIGGQEWRYLEKQLLDWRSGDRRNSVGGVMTSATKSLTDQEIQALATYLSGL